MKEFAPENPYRNTKIPRYVLDPLYLFGKSIQYCTENSQQIIPVSNYDSGDTVAEVIENIRYLPYEVGVFFDRNHRKIFDFTNYDEDECFLTLPKEWLPHLEIFIHNHPNSNWHFSNKDFLALPVIGCATAIVVCKDYTYVIEHWPHDWAKEAPEGLRKPEDYRNFICQYGRNTDMLIDTLMGSLVKVGLKTKYSAYDLKGRLVRDVPLTGDISTLPEGEEYRQFKAFRHLMYARK